MKKNIIILSALFLSAFAAAQNPAVMTQNLNQPFREGIYVGRYGYWSDMPVKIAYLSFIPGNGRKIPAEFFLCRPDGSAVFSGKPMRMRDPEGVLAPVGVNFPGEQIFALNFSEYKIPGKYFIKIRGYGISELFNIGGKMPVEIYPLPSLKTFEEQSHILNGDMKPIIQDSFLHTPLRWPVDTCP